MNLRDFCLCPGFGSALLTTYTFDPLFFERVVLPDLRAGGANLIVVLGDADEALPSIYAARDQLVGLGRTYRFIPVRIAGAFHPKICVRTSDNGALVACGSGNLTASGWLGRSGDESPSGNREVAAAWQIEPGSPSASDLRRVRSQLLNLPLPEHQLDQVGKTMNNTWLRSGAEGPQDADTAWTLSGIDRSLAATLEERWSGRRFKRLRLSTGSTDQSGEMLRWAHETFGVEEAIVETNADFCSFKPELLADLPLKLSFCPLDLPPRTHAKVFAFESDDEVALVSGSANCSSAAWRRTIAQNGNVESVIIYDRVDRSTLDDLFLSTVSVEISAAGLPDKTDEDRPKERKNAGPLLIAVELDTDNGRIRALLARLPKALDRVSLLVSDQEVVLDASDKAGWFSAAMPDIPFLTTPFARARLLSGEEIIETNSVWIEDETSLHRLAGRRSPVHNMGGVGNPSTADRSDELIRSVRSVADDLFEITDPETESPRGKREQAKKDEPTRTIKPEQLLVSMDDLKSRHPDAKPIGSSAEDLALSGLIAMLLGDDASDPEMEDATSGEHQISRQEKESENTEDGENANKEGGEGGRGNQRPEPTGPVRTQRQCQRLLSQLERVVTEMGKPEFAARASALQLARVAVFPLATTKLALRGEWITAELRDRTASVVRGCFEILLRRELIEHNKEPLIRAVEQRYRDDGKQDDFEAVIGDGVLFLALVAALPLLKRLGESTFEQALILRDLCRCEVLTAAVDEEIVAQWTRKLGSEDQIESTLTEIRRTYETVQAIEELLGPAWKDRNSFQPFYAREGDWLWNPKMGFVQIMDMDRETAKATIHARRKAKTIQNVKTNFYVNLRQIRETDDRAEVLIRELRVDR